ncbi:MAG: choice-of-anchor Q domain-containing protein, partial [Anaerolineae bacterium]
GNLRLDFGSPAIDAGKHSGCPSTDLDGLPRPTDGNGDGTAACDMGAYEAGTMICGVSAGNNYTFGDQSGVNLFVGIQGNLDCLYVDEMGLNHPHATTNLQTGRYWLIRGLQGDKQTAAADYGVNLTLPTTFTPDANDKVCRYTGSGQVWDCAANSYTANSITRNGVMQLSDWAAGNNAAPTAVMLHFFTANVAGSKVALEWQTAAEVDVVGFHVYRATAAAGLYTRITAGLIPAQGDALSGAAYRYVDAPGYGTFYYQLEAVHADGSATRHGPAGVQVVPPRIFLPTLLRGQ